MIEKKSGHEIVLIKMDKWKEIAKKYYGEDFKNWKFKCANCGNVQSINSILEHVGKVKDISSEEERDKVENLAWAVYLNCEGRMFEKLNLKKTQGCDWTLGGLFQCHKLIVENNGDRIKVFEFTDDEANIDVKKNDITSEYNSRIRALKEKCEGANGSWDNFEWDDWIVKEVRDLIKSGMENPLSWFNNIGLEEPLYGEVAEKTEMGRGRTRVKGRYIHRCNNIGFVILEDKSFKYVSS